jgi:hypothetical protein
MVSSVNPILHYIARTASLPSLGRMILSLGMYVVINSLSTSYLLSRLLLVYSKFLPLMNLQVIEWLEYAPTFLSGSEFENACSFVVLVMCLVVY